MKKFIPVLIFSIILSTSSCMRSMIKNALTSTPLGNKTFIHKSPKVGDYSILIDVVDEITITQKVIAVSSDSVIVRYDSSIYDGLYLETVVDFEGNIKKIDIIDGNERISAKIAQAGDPGYMVWRKMTLEDLNAVKIYGGSNLNFQTNDVNVKAGEFQFEIVGLNISSGGTSKIYLINKDVKFLQLVVFGIQNNESVSMFQLLESGNKE